MWLWLWWRNWVDEAWTNWAPLGSAALPWVGGALLALAAVSAGGIAWQGRNLRHATAIVTENVPEFAPQGGLIYRSRLRFRTPLGELVQVLDPRAGRSVAFPVGATIPVRYPVGEPRNATPATIWRVYGVALWIAIFGTVLFDIGYLLRARLRRAQQRAIQKST